MTIQPYKISSLKTKDVYWTVPAPSVQTKNSYVEDIASICSERLVYEELFSELFPNGYTKKHADGFLEFCKSGWSKECFNFFILSNNDQISGCISIKNTERDAGEVGYWMSSKHSGLATNALSQLCLAAKDLGFKRLFAQTKSNNSRSIRVLKNNDFHKDNSFVKDRDIGCESAFLRVL